MAQTGTSALTLPIYTLGASGGLGHTGTSAFTLPLPVLDAGGDVPKVGTADMTLPAFDLLAAGTRSRAPLAVQTTTPDTIRNDFIEQVKAISPAHARHKDKVWREAESVEEVKGPGIRVFRIENRPGALLEGGFVGDGAQRYFFLEVWVSYGSLDEDDDDSIIDEDGAQLEEAFRARIEQVVPGLQAIDRLGWVPADDSEDGGLFGFFEFEVIYYGRR